jgi:hypothetical protein
LGEPTWQTHRGSWRSPTQKISDSEVATMLISEQELVMGKPQKKYDPRDHQDQSQAQANLQGQLQGQGQAQGQLAVQSLDSKSDNKNDNDNNNDNKNINDNKNNVDNKVDNKTNNNTDNKVDNKLDNKVENTVDNKVNVDVDVKVDLDLHATGLSAPVIDLHDLTTTDSLVMPQVVNQTLNGDGNQFNIDQVNNLYDNDTLNSASVSYGGSSEYPAGGFHMDAKIEGGESKIDGAHMGDAAGAGAGIVSHADATLTQDAFTQTITQGANIQFNSLTMEVAGASLTDDHHTL